MNQVAAVVVTYNRLELLKECLEKLLSQNSPCDVLIVDNASSDGTESYIKTAYADNTRIHYRNTGANIGGAGGFNVGMRWAVEAGYEFVWVMDDDCMPREDALEKLLDADRILQGNYGWLSSVVLWKDGTICKMNLQRKNPYQSIQVSNKDIIKAEMASFVSLFIKSSIIQAYGLPLEEYFIWSDDWEYTRRISLNLNCYVVKKSKVIHFMNDNITVNISKDKLNRLWRYKYFYRNDIHFYKREGIKGIIWVICKNIWHSIQVIEVSTNKINKIALIWTNFAKGIKFNPKIEYIERRG